MPGSQNQLGEGGRGGAPRRHTCVGSHNMVKQTDPMNSLTPDPSAVTIPRQAIQGRLHLDQDVFKSRARMEAQQEAAWFHSCNHSRTGPGPAWLQEKVPSLTAVCNLWWTSPVLSLTLREETASQPEVTKLVTVRKLSSRATASCVIACDERRGGWKGHGAD